MGDVNVTFSGPYFDAAYDGITTRLIDNIEHDVAAQGLADVHDILNRSIRHPTPYYETQLRMRKTLGGEVVDDRGIVYGPWLEGVGSRNRTTRFKGYWGFRIGTQLVEARKVELSQDAVDKFEREVNA